MKKSFFYLFFIFLIFSCTGTKHNLSSSSRINLNNVPVDSKVKMGTLENGLTYYVRSNGKPENRAEMLLAVNAGSVLENDNQQGIAHFLEHMAFNGTKNFPKQDLVIFDLI